MFFTHCPDCQGNIGVEENPEIGQSVMCPDCGDVFEVVWLYPFTIGDPSNNRNTFYAQMSLKSSKLRSINN